MKKKIYIRPPLSSRLRVPAELPRSVPKPHLSLVTVSRSCACDKVPLTPDNRVTQAYCADAAYFSAGDNGMKVKVG